MREFTVKMAPKVGDSRIQLVLLVPHDFPIGDPGAGSIVEVKILGVSLPTANSAYAQFQTGDLPEGGVILRDDTLLHDGHQNFRATMSMRVEARRYWNVVVAFYSDFVFGKAAVQTAESSNHITVHASSRPA